MLAEVLMASSEVPAEQANREENYAPAVDRKVLDKANYPLLKCSVQKRLRYCQDKPHQHEDQRQTSQIP